MLLGRQGYQLPGEVAGGPLFAQESDHLACDAGRGALRMAALHFGLQRGQAGLDGGDVPLPVLAALPFAGRAVNENEACRNLLVIGGIGERMPQHGEFVVLARQRRVAAAAPLLLDGSKCNRFRAKPVSCKAWAVTLPRME